MVSFGAFRVEPSSARAVGTDREKRLMVVRIAAPAGIPRQPVLMEILLPLLDIGVR
jgi:hypothetical protein